MKHPFAIGLFLLLALAACNQAKVPEPEVAEQGRSIEGPTQMDLVSSDLQSVDSLMWRQPDSALALLLPWFDTCGDAMLASPQDGMDTTLETHSMRLYNRHYAHLLLAELLYKNDYAQANRAELLDAVAYFDSLLVISDTRGSDTRGVSLQRPTRRDARRAHANGATTAFLDSRAHYINGVGYYERDSVVEACREYIKALEIMESRFEEKDLTGKKARFMAYTYNRLGELFSAQFMMEPSIACYEQSLIYGKITPTSPFGVSNTLMQLGKQYDKLGQKENASKYYEQAREALPVLQGLIYREIIARIALCNYQLGMGREQSLDALKQILAQTGIDEERFTRYLAIGSIFYEENLFDSALFYLEPVFVCDDNLARQVPVANYLLIIYDSLGQEDKANECMRFLATHKKTEGENKALVSKLEDMYKDYSNQKLEKQAETERETAKKKVLNTVIPIAVTIAIVVFLVLILRGRRLLKNQQEEADRAFGEAEKKHLQWMADAEERHSEELRAQKDRSEKEIEKTKTRHQKELEAERLAYEKEQNALRQHLTERTAQVHALEEALNQQREEVKLRRVAFLKEPICQSIRNKLSGKNITTRENAYELGIALKDEDFEQLRAAVEKHYEGFDQLLLSQCPGLKQGLLALCHLHLLGINESEIAVLKNVSYSAIKKQNESLQEKLGVDESVAEFVLREAEGLCVPQGVPQSVSLDITQKILDLVSNNPKITREEIARQLGVSSKTIARNLKKVSDRIHYVGSGYSGHWEVIR